MGPKQSEALRGGEERFRGAFDHAAIGMALVAPDGQWLQVNRFLCEITGYSEAELLARTFQDITHPDDLDADLGFLRQVLSGEIASYQMEKRYLHKDGQVVWVLLTVSLVRDRHDQPVYFIKQLQDVSGRKLREQHLHDLTVALENAVEGISQLDPVGRYVSVNPAYASTVGYPPEEMIGMSWEPTVHPDDQGKMAAAYQAMLNTGRVEVEAKGVRKDGSVFYKQVVMVKALSPSGAFVGHHCFMKDITERKQAEEDRESLIGQLQESLATIKTLRGLLPVCAWCKQVRNDEGYWKHLEAHIQEDLDVSFTHGICPTCAEKARLEIDLMKP